MIAVSMNTKPSIRLVRIFSAASGWREMPSEDLAMAIPMAMAPAAPAAPMAMAAAMALEPVESALSAASVSCVATVAIPVSGAGFVGVRFGQGEDEKAGGEQRDQQGGGNAGNHGFHGGSILSVQLVSRVFWRVFRWVRSLRRRTAR